MGERGYGAVLALALLFGGTLLIGLATDVARLVAVWQEASHVAHTAAEVSAGWVEPEALYQGELRVEADSASRAGREFVREAGFVGHVEVSSDRVCVTVRSSVRPGLIRIIGAGAQRIEVTACAEPRRG